MRNYKPLKNIVMTTEATTVKPVTFASWYRQLRLVRKASYTKEVDGRVVHVPGDDIRFVDGLLVTNDPAVIEYIENRPEFKEGKIFKVRMPGDREKRMKSLEEREAEIAKREAALAAKEAKSNAGAEEGSSVSSGSPETDGLETLKKADLLAICEKEGVKDWEGFKKPGVTNKAIVDAIRQSREQGKEPGKTDDPAY